MQDYPSPPGHGTPPGWRTFEVANPSGVIRVWLAKPLAVETDYHKTLGNNWEGDAAVARVHRDEDDNVAHIVERPGVR